MDYSLGKMLHYIGLKDPIDYWSYYIYGVARSYAQPYINTDFNISKINDNLYIGDFPSACNKEELLKLGITHIVTAVVGVGEMFPDDFKYQLVDICDTKTTFVYPYLDECVRFIDNAIENGGKAFVHCMCGISRSATIIAAYLIYKYKYTVDEAIEKIKQCRDCVKPNDGFRHQLTIYANQIKSQTSGQIESTSTQQEF